MQTAVDYWKQAARKSELDPDQIASQNYYLPPAVHEEVRCRQLRFLEDLLRPLSTPPRVLDLGCGPGTWGLRLSHLAERWVGYDISPEFIETARSQAERLGRRNLRFEVGPLLDVQESPDFDVVVLGGILGYLDDQELPQLMAVVRRHLRPGGLVYARVSVSPSIYPRLSLSTNYPIHYRKVEEYVALFRAAGLYVTQERDVAFTEANLATAYTALARWFGRTGMTAYRFMQRLRPLTFGLARRLLDLTPLPQSMQFVLYPQA